MYQDWRTIFKDAGETRSAEGTTSQTVRGYVLTIWAVLLHQETRGEGQCDTAHLLFNKHIYIIYEGVYASVHVLRSFKSVQ